MTSFLATTTLKPTLGGSKLMLTPSAETPYSTEAKQILQLLKKKAPDADLDPPLDAVRAAESERLSTSTDQPPHAPLVAPTDALTTSLCYIGSKSLSHVLSYIERHRERLLSLGRAHPPLRTHIIAAVVAYWRDTQPGVAVNIVDKLLNYTIVTPGAVVEWAMGADANLGAGRPLADGWVYELVAGTLAKVTGRVRQIVQARAQPGLRHAQAAALDETLARERDDMRTLFATLADALAGVADGSNDVMMETGLGEEVGTGGGEVRGEAELALLRLWGAKWLRVFGRKAAVEERVVGEAARGFPEPVEDGAVDVGGDGGGDGVDVDGDGDVIAANDGVDGVDGANGVADAEAAEEDLLL